MKRLVPIMAAALAAGACGNSADEHGNMAGNHVAAAQGGEPTFQLPVLPGRPGAAYFTIDVPADHGALIEVTSPQTGRIEMHETMRRGSVSGMRPLQRIVPENGRIVLARGGLHLMLFDVDQSLAAGGTARLLLRFERGQTRTLEARIVDAGAEHGGH